MIAPLRTTGIALATALILGGCTSPVMVRGKVIRGDVSFIGAVDPSDPRLKGDGIAGADLTVRGVGVRSDRMLGDAVSGATGDFTLSIVDQDALKRPAEFHARFPSYMDARGEMAIPSKERRLLVVLRPVVLTPPPTVVPASTAP